MENSHENHKKKHTKKDKNDFKFKFLDITNIDSLKKTEIFDYIVKLHELLKSQSKKLKKYKEKLRKKKKEKHKRNDAENEVDEKVTAVKKLKNNTQELSSSSRKNQEKSVEDTKREDDNVEGDKAAHKTQPLSLVDEIKEAAENAQSQAGFVYEPTSGLFYDSKTGYYYNAEHGLYYDGNNGCYYKYNVEENKFEFHSQVYVEEPKEECAKKASVEHTNEDHTDNAKRKSSKKVIYVNSSSSSSSCYEDDYSSNSSSDRYDERHRRRRKIRKKTKNVKISRKRKMMLDKEDGELSCSDEADANVEKYPKIDEVSQSDTTHKYEDIARKYPPSLRLFVQETNLAKLKIGELFLITFKGGTLGREGSHDVIIPDINVSKYHLKFTYNEELSQYECIDLGSRNGTILNGKRMSNAKQESESFPILHGTSIQLSQTKLICHIHDGHITCNECEPGLNVPSSGSVDSAGQVDQQAAALTHKQVLKTIKKRYGLADEKYLIQQSTTNDRAAQRRKQHGSSDGNEKTVVASVETSIATENKGFKMLSKLGWSQGQTLGKNNTGLLEPIPLLTNEGRKGLGSDGMSLATTEVPRANKKSSERIKSLQITQERYNKSSSMSVQDAFSLVDDVEEEDDFQKKV